MAFQKIDDRDLKILQILSRDGRIKVSDLAKQLNLSATPCWERLRRLEKAGIVKSYHAEIALEKVADYMCTFVVLELENHRAESFQTFEREIDKHPEIMACWAIGGGYDYLMQVITSNVEKYQELMDKLLDRRVGISQYSTYIVTKSIKLNAPPPFDALSLTGTKID